jgi:hypothetical protein
MIFIVLNSQSITAIVMIRRRRTGPRSAAGFQLLFPKVALVPLVAVVVFSISVALLLSPSRLLYNKINTSRIDDSRELRPVLEPNNHLTTAAADNIQLQRTDRGARPFRPTPSLFSHDEEVTSVPISQLQRQQQPPTPPPPPQKRFPEEKEAGRSVSKQNPSGGAFVHIGKTGGSTISVLLRNGCHSFRPHPCRSVPDESMASRLIESYYHVPDFSFLQQSHHDFLVFSTRDPFDRVKSAFTWEHLENRLARNETVDEFKLAKYEEAYKCFPTLQRFVEYLGEEGVADRLRHADSTHFHYPHKQNWVSAESCVDLARAAFHGKVKLYNHFYFSYQKILSFLPGLIQPQQKKQQQPVDNAPTLCYAIRQEHLWNDWVKLNERLGQATGTVHEQETASRTIRNSTELELQNRLPVTRALQSVETLCRALRGEYRAYFWILQRARNLTPADVLQSVIKAKGNCPNLDVGSILSNSKPGR